MLKAETFVEENGLLNQEPSERDLTKIDRLDENSNLLFKEKKKHLSRQKQRNINKCDILKDFANPVIT